MTNESLEIITREADKLAQDADIIAMVQSIESSVPTTQNHYGRYMAILSPIAEDKVMCMITSLALCKAGGNKQGIMSALQVLGC